jgi:hypothetical protein
VVSFVYRPKRMFCTSTSMWLTVVRPPFFAAAATPASPQETSQSTDQAEARPSFVPRVVLFMSVSSGATTFEYRHPARRNAAARAANADLRIFIRPPVR